MKIFLTILGVILFMQQASFKQTQLNEARVKVAYEHVEDTVKKYFSTKKLSMDKFQLFIRAFKKEQILEAWIKENNKEQFILLHYLSLGINYPNESDLILSDKKKPGNAIYIHGGCATVGCIPITDESIKELYIMAVEARSAGQTTIPVHIFPSKLEKGVVEKLTIEQRANSATSAFWKNLEPVYRDFEETKKLNPIRVNASGLYTL
jgi:murein L,D-transpeptidase YafK